MLLQTCATHAAGLRQALEEGPPQRRPRQTSTRSMSFLVCFEPGRGHTAFAGVLAQLRAVHISITSVTKLHHTLKL